MTESKLSYLVSNSKQIESFHTFKDHEYGVSDFNQNKLKPNELATVSFDTTIKIYDLDNMINFKTLTQHSKGVWTCDYSSTNPMLLTGGNDNKIILWDTNSYKPISEINFHSEVVYDVKFSNSGKLFASCSKGMICIWDINNLKEPLSTIKDQHNEFVYSINFVDYDKHLVTGFIDGYMLLIDTNNIQEHKKYFIPKKEKIIYGIVDETGQKEGNSVSYIYFI
jgi:WD40 repeat protein